MAYSGSTALSSVNNPPTPLKGVLTRGSTVLTGQNHQVWSYSSTNLTTDIVASNFFTDGYEMGMRPGDIVMGSQYTSAGSSVIAFTSVVASVTTAGASLSTGGTVTSTFA